MSIKTKQFVCAVVTLCLMMLSLSGCHGKKISLNNIPDYSGNPYVEINGGEPFFTKKEMKSKEPFEKYSELDPLGRCGEAFACLGPETMPDEERESIANVTPTGWEYNGISNNNTYDFVEDNYIYNRCHLIGHQLAGENDNDKNLITGTRYLNIEGMLPYEDMIANYIRETGNHVLYRVTPIFKGYDYVARGVLMEAYSIEDSGKGITLCVYLYNVQPGVYIDYFTGVNIVEGGALPDYSEDNTNDNTDNNTNNSDANTDNSTEWTPITYVLNTNSKLYHLPDKPCSNSISDKNRAEFNGSKEEVEALGYRPCGKCKP